MPLTPGSRLGGDGRVFTATVRGLAWVTAMILATSADGFVAKPQQVSPPPLRGGVDLVTIDVQIAPSREAPMRDFLLSDFDIRIAGRKRPAVSATLLHYDTGAVTRDPPRAAGRRLRSAHPHACGNRRLLHARGAAADLANLHAVP